MSSGIALEELRAEFARRRLMAMPIAGTVAWSVAGVLGYVLPEPAAAIALFFCTGMIFPLGVLIGRLTGENVLKRDSELDRLFMMNIVMASLVWAIAVPFYLVERSSLPLTVGILAGLMWVPLSWMIRHWVGLFHGITRTGLIVAAWYLFPEQRFVMIPAVVVFVYGVSLAVLATRPRPESGATTIG